MHDQARTNSQRERLVKVFEFLKAYVELRYPPVRDINQQTKVLWLKDLPKHPSIEYHKERADEQESENSDVVLRVSRPTLTACPSPPAIIAKWLKPGWENIDNDIDVHVSQNVPGESGRARIERFEDVAQRPILLTAWRQQREEWRVNELPTRLSMSAFQALYEWFGIHEREAEQIEIFAGDGLLNCPDDNGRFNHPVLLQKLQLEFYPEKQKPQFVLRKREQPPELYLEFLRALPEANYRQIANCAEELRKTEFSPFGGSDTQGFFQRLIQGVLPAAGQLLHSDDAEEGSRSGVGQEASIAAGGHHQAVSVTKNGDRYDLSPPDAAKVTGPITAANLEVSLRRLREHGWEPTFTSGAGPTTRREPVITGAGPTIRRQPVIFMRQRRPGAGNVFDSVLEDIANRIDFPAALLQIVGLASAIPIEHPKDSGELALGNEDEEILLSKPANKEQLEIAQQLARKDCVLVQGPPGTGKTHTIANLLGHLLAQGKRILVTAHTPKALRVLRKKVVEPLQTLCISILQNDKQSQDELQQSVVQINARLTQSDRLLEREAIQLKQRRESIIRQLRETRSSLLNARQDEIRGVVFGGIDVRPIDAAKRIRKGVGSDDWIPSPVILGDAAPLSDAEVATLCQTNERFSLDDERELNASRPALETLPTPKQFQELVEEMAVLNTQNLRYREDLWEDTQKPENLVNLDQLLAIANKAIEFLRDSVAWELEAVQAGRDGEQAKQVWTSLNELIESTWQEVQNCLVVVMAHGPQIDDQRPPHVLMPIVEEITLHIEAGKSLGIVTKLTQPGWHRLAESVRIGGRGPTLNDPVHFRAVRALLRIQIVRQDLVGRWERQIAGQGGPTSAELGDKPEQVCRQFISRIRACCDWHVSTWIPLESEFRRSGFRWSAYLDSIPPETGANPELNRLRSAVLGDLEQILTARAGWLRSQYLSQVLSEWRARVPETSSPESLASRRLRESLHAAVPANYQKSYEELLRLKNLEADLAVRHSLLRRLERVAPAWASAIQNRVSVHSLSEPPGNPTTAWVWRQLHDELERRANVPLDDLQQRIEQLSRELLDVTAELVEKLTWVNLIRKTKPEQKQALGAFAAMRKRLTKSGKGVQDAELRVGARRAMEVAKGAVPVWIMPLNEVADSFDPRTTRFDVVIIDEASQCDPTAMFALYLGDQVLVVGDDEQVTPVAIGVDTEQVQKLRQVHLQDIPNPELYNGDFSIYGFAQVYFGGVIRLVEHFRCAPNIIAFSNALSYGNEIKPLREASSIKLSPHVLPYRVEAKRGRDDDTNSAEAEAVASLVCAAIEQAEYAKNQDGEPMTFGVVSLVANQQSMLVDSLLRQRLEPSEYIRRQILCGHAAQFQGDERDVMFLSVVDSPPSDPPLPMRQEGPKNIFKKRFNVAASRARDQMWVIYSLDHQTDLKPGDYRRRLIEHAINPEAREREIERLLPQIDPQSKEFEGRVLRLLVGKNFRVLPQFRVGNYRIDFVVVGGGKRLAVECDGERFHGPEKLLEDMERQANLERLGWKFARIRGSIFFQDEVRAMRPVFQRLNDLGVTADLNIQVDPVNSDSVTQRVIIRAQELRDSWLEKP
jgi:very-short-patch-repair endonuclease